MVRNLSKTKQKMAVLVPDEEVIFLKLNILPENKWFTLNWSNFELIEIRRKLAEVMFLLTSADDELGEESNDNTLRI